MLSSAEGPIRATNSRWMSFSCSITSTAPAHQKDVLRTHSDKINQELLKFLEQKAQRREVNRTTAAWLPTQAKLAWSYRSFGADGGRSGRACRGPRGGRQRGAGGVIFRRRGSNNEGLGRAVWLTNTRQRLLHSILVCLYYSRVITGPRGGGSVS